MEFTEAGLDDAKFTGFVPFAELDTCQDPALDRPGVYMVLRPSSTELTLSEMSTGFWHKDKDPAYALTKLRSQWNLLTPVLYIGKAGGLAGGTTIRQRLNLYQQYGAGRDVSHRGGKAVWQIEDAAKLLLVCWTDTPGLDPECVESQLLKDFKGADGAGFGAYPLANRKGGRKKCPHAPQCHWRSAVGVRSP
ncbi:hypothetical protein [Specibacter sp. RAF43]|uniref:hypothetical protein n=1 Tax=Specibacter sp. RAF43 TaxID=3233057 RepID=UPI003F9596A0